jgi:hypothetical protein
MMIFMQLVYVVILLLIKVYINILKFNIIKMKDMKEFNVLNVINIMEK